MSVYNRGSESSPNWWIRYSDGAGKTRRECGSASKGPCRSKRQAEALLRKRRAQVKDGTLDVPERVDPGGESVAEYATRWVQKRVDGGKVRSAHLEVARMKMHVVAHIGGLKMRQVTQQNYIEMLEAVEAKGLAPKTVHNVHTMARTMFREARRAGVIESDPSEIPKVLVPKPTKKVKEIHPNPEARQLMTPSAEPSMHIFAAVAFYTGMRQGEICGLRWEDLDGDSILLTQQYGGLPLKTDEPRIIPLHTELQRILLAWSENDDCSERFVVERRGAMYSRSDSYQAWLRHCRHHGIRSRGVHVLRHTMITAARRGGADKEWLRRVTHNPTGDIIDRYTAIDWGSLRAAVECVRYDDDGSNSTTRAHGAWGPRKKAAKSKVGDLGTTYRSSTIGAKNSEKSERKGRRKTPRKRGVEPTQHKCAATWALALAAESLLGGGR